MTTTQATLTLPAGATRRPLWDTGPIGADEITYTPDDLTYPRTLFQVIAIDLVDGTRLRPGFGYGGGAHVEAFIRNTIPSEICYTDGTTFKWVRLPLTHVSCIRRSPQVTLHARRMLAGNQGTVMA